MGTKLTVPKESTPVVNVRELGTFVGKLLDKGREVKVKKGTQFVYSFAFIDSTCPIEVRGADGKYTELEQIEEGQKVCVFAPTVLHEALQRGQIGQKITINSLGMPDGKNYYNFDVEAD